MRKTALVLGLLLTICVHAGSAPELVRDFRKEIEIVSSDPEWFFSTGERAFFFANDGSGRELWTSDGTAEGTHLVADLTPGPGPDSLGVEPGFVASGDLVYFWHRDDFSSEPSLWRTDGTARGTFPLLDPDSYTGAIVPFGERGAIVSAGELYVTDGETAHEVDTSFTPDAMVTLNGVVYGLTRSSLWRTDGTAEGTRHVFGFERLMDDQIVVHDGAIYVLGTLLASDTAEIFRSDGTAEGTKLVASVGSHEHWPRLLATDAGVFALVTQGTSTHGMRITATGASPAFVLQGEYDGGFVAATPGFLVIETDNPDRVWRTDGTQQGTRAIADDDYYGDSLAVAGPYALYAASSGVWAHDGTSARLLTPLADTRLEAAQVGERFVLPVRDGEHGAELWISDGSTAGTALLENIHPDTDSEGSLARRIGPTIFFRAHSDEHGLEPWAIDAAGLRVMDIDTGPDSSHPKLFTEVNGWLMFLSDPESNHPSQIRVTNGDGLHTIMSYDFDPWWPNELASFPVTGGRAFVFGDGDGNEVWTTDGTIEGTRRGTSLPYMDSDFDPVAANGVVFFVSDAKALWRTDGTPAGTYALASDVRQLHATPSKLFFIAESTAFGAELWVSDGTLAGTHVVKDIRVGSEDGFPQIYDYATVFQTLGDAVVFAADDGVHGVEPWLSDGTEAGTFLLRDAAPGAASSMLPRFDLDVTASAGGFVYFVADDGVHGRELWRTDGTPDGTRLVYDISRGRASSTPAQMRAMGDRVYFAADDGVHGRELWWSSLAGTALLADTAAGADASLPHDITELDGWIYYFAQTEAVGDELWRVEAPRVRRRAVR